MFGLKSLAGLDIGNSGVKTCEVSSFIKKVSLKRFDITKMPEKSFKSGEILNVSSIKTSLKSGLKKYPKSISFGVSGSAVMVKKISIPQMAQELIPEQIRWEAEQYIPFNIDEVNIDYVVLSQKADESTMDLLLVAAQQSRLNQYRDLLVQSGLQPSIADVSSFALVNCFLHNYPELKNSTLGLIDAGAFFTHFVVVKNGEVVFARDLPVGGLKVSEDLAKNLGVSEEEAELIKKNNKDLPDLALDSIASTSRSMADQILGSVEFFQETSGGDKIDSFYITGGNCLLNGFSDVLAQTLSKPVELIDVFRKIQVGSSVLKSNTEEDLQYRSAVAIGLALRKLGGVEK